MLYKDFCTITGLPGTLVVEENFQDVRICFIRQQVKDCAFKFVNKKKYHKSEPWSSHYRKRLSVRGPFPTKQENVDHRTEGTPQHQLLHIYNKLCSFE